MTDAAALSRLVGAGVLDAELAALLSLLVEGGVPLVVAGRDTAAADELRAALRDMAGAPAAEPGLLVADSLEEVVRLAGARLVTEIPDELRDLGVVAVTRLVDGRPRVVAAHYVRPLERDAGGHVQRRGPAVLAAWDERAGSWEHFAWGVTAELAERAGLALAEFERRRQAHEAALLQSGDGAARHRH